MNIMNLIRQKAADNSGCSGVTIAFLGDSVTQGCFEVYTTPEHNVGTIFEKESAYHNKLGQILSMLYPTVPVNLMNAGISGDWAIRGLARLERDVLRHRPDLVVVCYGLNDVNGGMENIAEYEEALEGILGKIKEEGIEVIFMTPNMMNTGISIHIQGEEVRRIAENTCRFQNEGIMDAYVETARAVCSRLEIPICDCYAKWKNLYENGVNVTELLANKINHPAREMHWLFASELADVMMR